MWVFKSLLSGSETNISLHLFNKCFQQTTKRISAKKRDVQQQIAQAQQGEKGLAGGVREELQQLESTLDDLEHSREKQERRIQVGDRK